jgi:hypothetical protein
MSKNKNRGKVQGTSSATEQVNPVAETQVATTETVENVVTEQTSPEATSAVEEVVVTPAGTPEPSPEVNVPETGTAEAPVEVAVPVNKIPVWPKKDLLGKPQMMDEKKATEKILNKGEVVVDPATGENIHLLRVFRGRRVFYTKGRIDVVETQQAENTEPAVAN